MSNAIKFTPPKGTVSISAKVSHNGCQGEGGDGIIEPLLEEEAILMASAEGGEGESSFSSSVKGDDVDLNDTVTFTDEDGKTYKKSSTFILSFRDTGSGISQVPTGPRACRYFL